MPLWLFTHSAGAFSAEEKEELAKKITRLYTKIGLPAFYVNTQFFERGPFDIFCGEESPKKFTTISIYHVARAFQNEAQRDKFLEKVDGILNPMLKPKGMSWEYFIQEAPREYWKINGIIPPPTGSEMEKKWLAANKPIEEDSAVRSKL
ncbi:hypothetical protein DIS24_g11807 [Lasiodiplodia hormozganensis]|uniref:Tautomerase cis-CaaD-like domain-containing protein n=1 Tax=Lasiodiplodia hormozganensis TaxID=869390 RepID=A0AA39WHE1_9PEZI|nr:hypothetical protein DIS24_g11807 [Lasiodiplodia hormozganensis]